MNTRCHCVCARVRACKKLKFQLSCILDCFHHPSVNSSSYYYAGFFEHGNEPSGSIKKAGCLTSWVTISFSKNMLHHGESKLYYYDDWCRAITDVAPCRQGDRVLCMCRFVIVTEFSSLYANKWAKSSETWRLAELYWTVDFLTLAFSTLKYVQTAF
jgi:hypothetical protein